jgi:protein transport protein SEC23
MEYILPETK